MFSTRLLSIAGAAALAAGALCAQAPAPASTYYQTIVKEAKARIREVEAAKVEEMKKANPGMVMVDVREDNEWDKGRAAGAVHVGRGVLESSVESKIKDKATPILVYCHGGSRSALAADVLGKMGYTNVYSLAGGFTAYEKAGLPTEK